MVGVHVIVTAKPEVNVSEPDGHPANDPDTSDAIELRLGADLTHLPLIRAVAANIALRADFDLDATADLRLAVDEACSTLITRAVTGTTMVCQFTIADRELRFAANVRSTEQDAPNTKSFGWRVLSTLTDSATGWIDASSANGHGQLMHIALAKRTPAVEA